MADFSTVLVRATPQVVQVNSSVPGSYDNVGRLSFGYLSVKEYGAKGDGGTDDTAAIQNCATAAVAAGLDVVFPKTSAYYKVTGTITATGKVNFLGHAKIKTTSTTAPIIKATGNDVTIQEGLWLEGPSTHSSAQGGGMGFYALGASAASPLTGILVRDAIITGFNLYGVCMEWVDGFLVRDTTITEIANAGIITLSAMNGRIHHNHIATIGSTSSTYGIGIGRRNNDSSTTVPMSADILVDHNRVKDVTAWEGLDTHGGNRIVFDANIVTGCFVGINVGESSNGSSVPTFAPVDCHVVNNIFASGKTDGTAGTGISFTGVTASTFATGRVHGNTVRGHGTDTNSLAVGSVILKTSKYVRVTHNQIYEPAPQGIALVNDNYEFLCEGNVIVDVWSELSGAPSGIALGSNNNTGTIVNNELATGTKSATHLNVNGLRIDGTSGMVITLGRNNFAAATNPYLNPGASQLLGPESTLRTSVGDADVTLQVGVNSETQCYATTLTQNRAVTLSTTGAYDGARFRIVRTGLGNFTLNVGGLKTIPSATAATVEVVFRAGAWQLAAYSLL